MNRFLVIVVLAGAAQGCQFNSSASSTEEGVAPLVDTSGLEIRRVWAGSDADFYVSAPSPDGAMMTEVDWMTGDLSLIQLATGEEQRVTNKGSWQDSPDYAEHSVFSPDGEWIAYSWFHGQGLTPVASGGYEVRMIRRNGTDMKVLFPRNEDFAYVAVEDWSRDGQFILVTAFRRDRTSQIGIITVADATYQAVKSHDWRHPTVAAFSPDGSAIAYDFPDEKASQRDILLLSIGGGEETSLVTGPGDDLLLGWLPDGSGILYRSRTKESSSVWALRVKDGHAVGSPQLVRPDVWNLVPLGFSRDSYFYGVEVERRQIYVAPVDLENSRKLGNGTPLGAGTDAAVGTSPVWSPDGQHLAHVESGLTDRLVIRRLDSQVEQSINLFTKQTRSLAWSRDSNRIFFYGVDLDGRQGIHQVDLVTGLVSATLTTGPVTVQFLSFYDLGPDEKIYFRQPISKTAGGPDQGEEKLFSLIAYDPTSGQRTEIAEVPAGRRLSVSPDGKLVALHAFNSSGKGSHILVVPTSGGEPRTVFSAASCLTSTETSCRSAGNRGNLPWSPDGKSILYFFVSEKGVGGVLQIPIDGGEPRVVLELAEILPNSIGDEPVTAWELALSPDGRHLSYVTGEERGEYWMMSGFSKVSNTEAGLR